MNITIFSLCLIWGFNFVIMKSANGVFPPVLFASYRFLVGSIALFTYSYFKKVPLPSRQNLRWYMLCGLLQTTYFNVAIQVSLLHTSAGLVSVLTYSMPLFFSVLAHFFIPGERLSLRKTIGICLGLAGLFLALNINSPDAKLWSLMLALTSAIAWALSNLIIKTKLKDCDKLQFTSWQMISGTAALFLFSFLFESGNSAWNGISVVYILYSGVLASALAFSLWSLILTKVEASKASIPLLLVPIIGIISSSIFLNEKLQATTIAGVSLVLLGIWTVNRSSRRRDDTLDSIRLSDK
ncbi:DMT family transporter [Youngiibacter fragilis]|uniref:Membrane protein n=1 Tax=Youngiibacter fragilis 232.1 TaxID=994573 RepID=V7I936_9CLOT|nr:DMT family transporter [Youngiibacter fragilis]ETA82353.1 membrane protein [Youngiibacter fragilis 232.1]